MTVAAAMTAMAAVAKETAMVVKAEAKAAAAAQKAPSRGRTDDLRLQRKQEQGEKKGDMWTAEEWTNAVRATAARPLRCTPAAPQPLARC